MVDERWPLTSGLPAELTSFVGRDRELALVRELFERFRLVTLTGVGGSGKTRLALEAAAELEIGFRHRAAVVELAPLSDPALISQAILQALGARDVTSSSADETLREIVAELDVLVVLDNCEHLIEGCAVLVEGLLRSSGALRVLATSREPLGIDGEATLPVPPLTEPEGLQLFGDRAAASVPAFVVDDSNVAVVTTVCQQLDGLPLAIELAAARVRSMSIDDILHRLDDRFSLLTRRSRTGELRHATLRATVDWSHDLLSAEERTLFRRLAVFAGGWQLTDAEAVCTDERLSDFLDVHTSLVDRSLVVAEMAEGPARYRLLATLRDYAAERLADAKEVDEFRSRHFVHFLRVAETYYEQRIAGGSDVGLGMLARHRDNFRAALGWAVHLDDEGALRLTGALDDFWRMVSAAEGWRWLERTLPGSDAEGPYRLRALLTAGMLAAYIPAYSEGTGLLAEVAATAERAGDRVSEAWAELWLGRIALFSGDATRAEQHLDNALHAHEALGNAAGLVRSLSLLGLLQALILGGHADGEAKLERAAALAHDVGDTWGEGYARMMQGLCAADVGDLERATSCSRAALRSSTLGPLLGVPLQCMGRVAVEHDPARAMRLLGATAGHFQRTGTVPPPFVQQRIDATRQRASEILGSDAAARARIEGREMTIDEAVSYALSDEPGAMPTIPNGVTPREAQVAALVAQGHTNRDIAGALHISVRTAESHVDHILTKLALANRTQLAAWARQNLTQDP